MTPLFTPCKELWINTLKRLACNKESSFSSNQVCFCINLMWWGREAYFIVTNSQFKYFSHSYYILSVQSIQHFKIVQRYVRIVYQKKLQKNCTQYHSATNLKGFYVLKCIIFFLLLEWYDTFYRTKIQLKSTQSLSILWLNDI